MTGDITVLTSMKDCCIEEGNLFSMSVVEKTGSCSQIAGRNIQV